MSLIKLFEKKNRLLFYTFFTFLFQLNIWGYSYIKKTSYAYEFSQPIQNRFDNYPVINLNSAFLNTFSVFNYPDQNNTISVATFNENCSTYRKTFSINLKNVNINYECFSESPDGMDLVANEVIEPIYKISYDKQLNLPQIAKISNYIFDFDVEHLAEDFLTFIDVEHLRTRLGTNIHKAKTLMGKHFANSLKFAADQYENDRLLCLFFACYCLEAAFFLEGRTSFIDEFNPSLSFFYILFRCVLINIGAYMLLRFHVMKVLKTGVLNTHEQNLFVSDWPFFQFHNILDILDKHFEDSILNLNLGIFKLPGWLVSTNFWLLVGSLFFPFFSYYDLLFCDFISTLSEKKPKEIEFHNEEIKNNKEDDIFMEV
ncbi:hypothetical protein PACTADRAFT_16538 [Pachysolen tannophilus NRRL Y-2460]|uniref:Uncharacterized protein n=1 Tax=Pachysolen tannophilus NRRL Y-2460 TaxID=669874 RepID=A0A1E4TX87_PACTA|nr:hypothetical protein PACTADRAFT_16538 [Pachysolen tannophilus NRRL Y-2460]